MVRWIRTRINIEEDMTTMSFYLFSRRNFYQTGTKKQNQLQSRKPKVFLWNVILPNVADIASM